MESDVEKYGSCFCGLYVSLEVSKGIKPFAPVAESRPKSRTFAMLSKNSDCGISKTAVWKCSLCGYEHTGDTPPEKCPKCAAPKTMFKKKDCTPETVWKCSACGYEHKGDNPPDECPRCGVSREMFSTDA
jgi:rubrerythrin